MDYEAITNRDMAPHLKDTSDCPSVVQIIGAPMACAEGIKDTWRDIAAWAAGQLGVRYGDQVRVEYYDLFDPGVPLLPAGAQLPVVLVNGEVVSSGGKISLPAIRKRLESLSPPILPDHKRS